MAGINYLFPPDKINELPSWRFYLHFVAPETDTHELVQQAKARLSSTQFDIIEFPFGIDAITYSDDSNEVSIPYSVTEENRAQANSLALYESDVWKVLGVMASAGFQSDVYYEAIDWEE